MPPSVQRRRFPELKVPDEPCSLKCYTLLEGVKEKLEESRQPLSDYEMSSDESNDDESSRYSKDYPSNMKINNTNESLNSGSKLLLAPDDEWNGSDQSLFRALQNVYLRNYCIIANHMVYKTCR